MKVHIHHHLHFDDALGRMIVAHLADIGDRIAALSTKVTKSENRIMVNIQDLQAKADAEMARIAAETDVVNAVKVVVDSQNEKLAALKQQVADLVASGSVDPAALQQLSDTLDAISALDTSNANVVAEAVAAGTPAEQPNP